MVSQITRAQELRRAQTGTEAKLWRVLRNRQLNGWKFRRQCPIDRYVADFVCVEANLVVEVDGATHSTEEELAWDRQRTGTIENCGFAILRLTNAEILENLDGVRETILAAMERRSVV